MADNPDEYGTMKRTTTAYALDSLTIQDQYELAKKLAANCGYKLAAKDNERSLEIKTLKEKINRGYGGLPVVDRKILVEGLEALLK